MSVILLWLYGWVLKNLVLQFFIPQKDTTNHIQHLIVYYFVITFVF